MKKADELSQHRGFGPVRQPVGRSARTDCSASELARRIPFRMSAHLNMGTRHELHYLNEPLNVCCVITTPYRNGNPGKAKREYAINNPRTTWYPTLAELLECNDSLRREAEGLYPPNPTGQGRADCGA